jgi:hypothetical protein
MTNQQHPIIPPEDLLQQLRHSPDTWLEQITIAYQAGADIELKACCEWLAREISAPYHTHHRTTQRWYRQNALHEARRPEPPSLKEQALERLELAKKYVDVEPIRRALEALDD